MNWDAVGAIAESIGAFAVFCSLIYLAVQTRNNTRALRSAAFHQVRDSFSDVSLVMVQDPSILKMLGDAMRNDPEMSEEDILRFRAFLTTFYRRGESAYFQSRDGTLQLESWFGIRETIINVLDNELGNAWWQESEKRFTKEYHSEISKTLDQRKSGQGSDEDSSTSRTLVSDA